MPAVKFVYMNCERHCEKSEKDTACENAEKPAKETPCAKMLQSFRFRESRREHCKSDRVREDSEKATLFAIREMTANIVCCQGVKKK